MPHSMTAFASQAKNSEFGDISCEIRSVNSRFLDLNIILSDSIKHLEAEVEKIVKSQITRGKVEVKILINAKSNFEQLVLNQTKFDNVTSILQNMENQLVSLNPFTVANQNTNIDLVRILQLPDMLINQQNISDEFNTLCLDLLQESMQEFKNAREKEGKKLGEIILQKAINAKTFLQQIENMAEDSTAVLQQKLNDKLAKLDVKIDEDRLAQEVGLLVQKADIYEEIDRANTHIQALQDILSTSGPCGRKLDFLLQELQRETNTMASKAHNVQINNLTIELKVINEQIREQIQNLE